MSGFATLHRRALMHPLLSDAARLGAWTWLILQAAWKPTPFDINGKIVTLQRGQVCTSRSQLAKAWGMSPSAVERFLTRLETEQMIERATGQGRSIITVCNYDHYQTQSDEAGQATGQATGQGPDRDRTTKEQGNKETREPNGSPPLTPQPIRGRDWPDIPDWVPAEAWNGFIEMRRRKRANPTARAAKLLIGKLDKLRKSGCDPGAVLDQSTASNWTDIYPPKDARDDRNRNHPPRDNRDGLLRAVDRELGIDGDWQPTSQTG